MRKRFILSCLLLSLYCLTPAYSLLIKSTLSEDRQEITVHFTTKKLNRDEIRSICKEEFTTEEFSHDGLWREISQEELSPIISRVTGWDSNLKSVKVVSFHFQNISSDSHLSLLKNYITDFNSILYDIKENYHFRLRNLDAAFNYENVERDKEKIAEFKEFLTEFRQRKKALLDK